MVNLVTTLRSLSVVREAIDEFAAPSEMEPALFKSYLLIASRLLAILSPRKDVEGSIG
jgi:hypothetical protein